MAVEIQLISEHVLKYGLDMAKILKTVQSSELSRNSAKVFEEAEKSPVLVTRRDGVNLVLMSEAEHNTREEFDQLINQLVSASNPTGKDFLGRLAGQLPWMLALSEENRERAAEELSDAIRSSLATGQTNLAISILEAWRQTATALAAGLAGSEDWLEVPILVERP